MARTLARTARPVAFAAILLLAPAFAQAQTTTAFGWDYNLTKRCVKSPHPEAANYYVDDTQCGDDDKRWTIAVESEQDFGVSCPGPVNQSFPINAEGSPVTLGWQPHVDELERENWSVNVTTDLQSTTHPCGDAYWTWFMFMDHAAHGGGPFPRPDTATFSATVNYTESITNGATRAIAMFRAFWDGKPRAIELSFQGSNWGDNVPGDPLVFTYHDSPERQFVGVDGKALRINIPQGTDALLRIPWYKIVKLLVKKGYFTAPSGGWANTATTAAGLGHEVKSNTATNSVSASLSFTNFRLEQLTRSR